MSKRLLFSIAILAVTIGIASTSPIGPVHAQYDYTPLERIPGTEENSGEMDDYIQAIYRFALWSVGIAALFMIAVGGMMYLTSAGNTSQVGTAKKVIFDALIGLLLAILAWLILYVINPDLVEVDLDFSAASIQNVATTSGTTTTDGDGTADGTATGTATGDGSAGSCNGLSTQSGIGSQCKDVSAELGDLLDCIQQQMPSAVISSISDSAGFASCKYQFNESKCAHSATSCHYGGGASKTSAVCLHSQAVDIAIRNSAGVHSETVRNQVLAAGRACNGRVLSEGDHVHISTQAGAACCTR